MTKCSHGHDYCMGDDEVDEILKRNQETVGWTIVQVGNDDNRFCYTVGMNQLGKKELIMCGPIDARVLHNVASQHYLSEEKSFPTSQPISGLIKNDLNLTFLDVDEENVKEYLIIAGPVEAQQMVWPDTNGLFPWDEDSQFEEGGDFHGWQVLLGKYTPN